MFGKGWVALDEVRPLVTDKPITSGTLSALFKGGSANSAGFLLAVMKHEGLVQASGRAYERLDGKTFFAEIKALMTPATKAPRAKAAVHVSDVHGPIDTLRKAKAAEKAASKPAVYISEVHGPLIPEPRKPAKKAVKR